LRLLEWISFWNANTETEIQIESKFTMATVFINCKNCSEIVTPSVALISSYIIKNRRYVQEKGLSAPMSSSQQ
jgi:hypothetical protein